jgi:hypothetical protein
MLLQAVLVRRGARADPGGPRNSDLPCAGRQATEDEMPSVAAISG